MNNDDYFWAYGAYNCDRIDFLWEHGSRKDTIGFIREYNKHVRAEDKVPKDWHLLAAELLRRAADAVEEEPEKATGPVVKALGLQAGNSHELRDDSIRIAIQQLIDKKTSARKAQQIIAKRVHMDAETIRRKIWDTRNKERTKWIAKDSPKMDFLSYKYPNKNEKD